ncbi:hypothetical protein BC832DRAFT_520882, partial [Gaertneriomyces semiglobifer]
DKEIQLPSFKKKDKPREIPKELLSANEASRKKRAKSARAPRRRASGDEQSGDDAETRERSLSPESRKREEAKRDVEEALNRIKPKRIKRQTDDADMDEFIAQMVDGMKDAFFKDQELNKKKQPAVARLKMLPVVMPHLQRDHLFDQMLDGNILEGIKMWYVLEPLPDASLPSLDIQLQLFEVLAKMPITTEYLRSSLLGRIVNFYSKCDRVTPEVRKTATQLVDKWMRPILHRSNNYRDHKLIPTESTGEIRRLMEMPASETRTRIPMPVAQAFTALPAQRV